MSLPDLDLPGDPAGHRVVVAMSGGVCDGCFARRACQIAKSCITNGLADWTGS
jgi:hypothetical protein